MKFMLNFIVRIMRGTHYIYQKNWGSSAIYMTHFQIGLLFSLFSFPVAVYIGHILIGEIMVVASICALSGIFIPSLIYRTYGGESNVLTDVAVGDEKEIKKDRILAEVSFWLTMIVFYLVITNWLFVD
ncbi:hypothetical protein [Ferrimonas balearica]|uniref:hypothetical protein n=1 Tax=Ferrimonas balearica TaxID=44012 RepID=UPI001C99805A|nr:hypothetical protein [Ferrimonas balearica]MBY5990988.1 hypothetical protein [Ferrimonas balearica]